MSPHPGFTRLSFVGRNGLRGVALADAVDNESYYDARDGKAYHVSENVLVARGAGILVKLVAYQQVHKCVGQVADNR